MAGRESSSVSSCVKYSLFFMNVLFWLIGLALLAAGIYARTLKDIDAVLKSTVAWYMDPSIYFMFFGSIVFILAFLGCIGSLRENITMLKIFEYVIDFIMLLQIICVVAIYLARDKVKAFAVNKLIDVVPKYRDDLDLQSIIDYLQINLKCCGVKGYNDWEKNVYFNCSSPGTEACGVPYSCCINDQVNTQCGYQVRSSSTSDVERRKKIYTIGCIDATIKVLLTDNLYYTIGIGAGIIVMELVATGLAHSLVTGIKRQIMKQKRPQHIHGFQYSIPQLSPKDDRATFQGI